MAVGLGSVGCMVQKVDNDGQNVVLVVNDAGENVEVVFVAQSPPEMVGNPKRNSKATEAASSER